VDVPGSTAVSICEVFLASLSAVNSLEVSRTAPYSTPFARIDVLEFSPAGRALPLVPASKLTHNNVQVRIEFYLHGAIAAVNQV
jgi:hypothetical protein